MYNNGFDFDFISDSQEENISKEENNYDLISQFEMKTSMWMDDAKLIGSIKKEELTFDWYHFTLYDIARDINRREIGRKENRARVIVFPYNIRQGGYGLTSDICAYVEEDGAFNCGVSGTNGKKTFLLKAKDHDFVISGRWARNEFLSMANSMVNIAEDIEIDCHKEEYRSVKNKYQILEIQLKNKTLSVVPTWLKNKNEYAPFVAVIRDNETGEGIVAATQKFLEYGNIKIGCFWHENEFKCYKL